MMKRAMDNPKIRFLTNTTVRAWRGKDSLLSGATVLTNGVEREVCKCTNKIDYDYIKFK